MVGIVLVSHSRALAEGAAELARQMGGEDVRVAPAGGLDGPDDAIGTDAMRVLAAIESVWSPDGVLVLMDLGSAVLSAEMAIEFLDEDRRPSVLLTDAPFVEGAVAAAVAAKLDRSLEEVASEARGGLAGKAAHLGEPAPPVAGAGHRNAGAAADRRSRGADHRRGRSAPWASRTAGGAAGPDGRRVRRGRARRRRDRRTRTGERPQPERRRDPRRDGGACPGDRGAGPAGGRGGRGRPSARRAPVRRSAGGPRAADAASAGRAGRMAGRDSEKRPQPEGVLHGLPASPGVAIGPARRFSTPEIAVPDGLASRGNDEELAALDEALAGARAEIARQRDDVAARAGTGARRDLRGAPAVPR